jgi:hypothetical protein
MAPAGTSHTGRGGRHRKRWAPPTVLSCLELSDDDESSSLSTSAPEPAAPRAKKQRQSKTQAVKALQKSRDKTETPPPPVESPDLSGPGKNPARKALKAPKAPPLDFSRIRTESLRDAPERSTPRMFGLEHCPVYTPTLEEFIKPMEYVEKIARQAKDYGICKIVPPEGWRPPFALDTEVSGEI